MWKKGEGWCCSVRAYAASRKWEQANPEKKRESNSKINPRRLIVSGMYLGMAGFTQQEREALLNGETE